MTIAAAERPLSVPASAVWNEEKGQWDYGAFDEQGRAHGPHRIFRRDGSRLVECTYDHGVLVGVFRRFHPNGELARVGEYKDGRLHGRLQAFASAAATTEALRGCCVPPGAFRLETTYSDGDRIEVERFYDRAGNLLLSDGSIHPARPEEVPEGAGFEEPTRRFWLGKYDPETGREGLYRWWSAGGVLVEERTYRAGKEHGVCRWFTEQGALVEESFFEEGRRTGPFVRVCEPEMFADGRFQKQRGAFTRDLATGTWEFLDESGHVAGRYEMGEPLDEALASPALAPEKRSADEWRDVARALRSEHRTAEALCAFARAAAMDHDRARFERELDGARPELRSERAEQLASQAIQDAKGSLTLLSDALLRGGDPAMLLRSIASSCPVASQAPLDLVDASLLLAKNRDACYVTRTLLDLSVGDPDAATNDAGKLSDEYAEARESLLVFRRVLFPTFDFWPARAKFDSLMTDLPDEPCQAVARVREAIQKCATRLELVRRAICARVAGTPSWLVPDLSRLLPGGLVPLEKKTLEIEFDEEELEANDNHGERIERVEVDETLELANYDVTALMKRARSDWNALCWLCWSVGLDRIDLPEEIVAPENFAEAVGMAIERQWRSRDRLKTAGLLAMTKGVRGFEWEGLDIDSMPAFLAEMAAHEYTDLRAVFFFLCDDRQLSPWQDNLRSD